MKTKLPLVVLLSATLYLPLQAGVTDITRLSGHYASGFNGGEFTVGQLDSALQGVLHLYADAAKNQGHNPSFQTFCLELSEGTASNVDYTIDDYAIKGGVGADPGLGGDPLSDATAWLYKQFATGQINSYGATVYDYTPGAGRELSARGFQKAVWYLEEVIAFDTEAKPFLDLYVDTVLNQDPSGYSTSDYEALRSLANNQVGVAVFNPYTYSAGGDVVFRQSQLILVPSPGALVLGSLGLVVVRLVRARRKA